MSDNGHGFTLSDEHKMIQKAARNFAEKEIKPIAAEFDESGDFPTDTIKKMGEMGFMGVDVPEEYGGAGMDTLAYVLALEEISKADASHGIIMSVNNSLFNYGILIFGSDFQKETYLKGVSSGERIGAYSLTEPIAGSDAGSIISRAVLDGDHYILNGRKSWVTSGPVADYIVVFMMTDPEKKERGISAFIIETDKPGFTGDKKEPKLGIRASATSELMFEDYRCPTENRLGEEGEGFKIAMTVLDAGRIGVATQALGIAEAAYEASIAYVQEREAFGKKIGQFQGIAFKLADMAEFLSRLEKWIRRKLRVIVWKHWKKIKTRDTNAGFRSNLAAFAADTSIPKTPTSRPSNINWCCNWSQRKCRW